MARRLTLTFLAVASPALLVTFAAGRGAGEVVFSLLATAFPFALIALGAAGRDGRLGALAWPLLAVAAAFEALVAGMLALRGQVLDGPWIGGLPLAAAIQVYGLFLAPLLVVPLLYAATFEENGLRRRDLDELRRRFGGSAE